MDALIWGVLMHWAPLELWQGAQQPQQPFMPHHCTATQAGAPLGAIISFPWGPFVPRQCWNHFSHCCPYQWLYSPPETNPQGFRLTWAPELVCTINVCTRHTNSTSELKGSWRHIKHKTVPSSHRHLTFDFNSHSPGTDLIALWGRIPADSEPSPHSVVCLSAWITHYLQFWHSLSLCHDILSEVPWPSKEKSFLHYRGVQNG